MRLISLSFTLCFLLLFAAPVYATELIFVENPVSDNYKASYNANPSIKENRTWLSMDTIQVLGTIWRPLRVSQNTFSTQQLLVSSDSRQATLTARIVHGAASALVIRVDSDGRWGPLLSVQSMPLRLQIELSINGDLKAIGVADYLPESFVNQLEVNGPYGRWYLQAKPIPTDWETKNPTGNYLAADQAAPQILRIILPLKTKVRKIKVRVRAKAFNGASVTQIRVKVGKGSYSAWQSSKIARTITLPNRKGSYLISVQVRDSNGVISATKTRRVKLS